jgi:hypothetical protein
MTIRNAVIKTATTAITATGGTNVTLSSLGDNVGLHKGTFGGTDFSTRNTFQFSANAARVTSKDENPTGYSYERNRLVTRFPMLASDNTVIFATIASDLSSPVTMTNGQKLDALRMHAQMLGIAEFESFWISRDTN